MAKENNKKLSETEITELINDIQSEFPVENITYKNYHIWPCLKQQLCYGLFFDTEKIPESTIEKPKAELKLSLWQKRFAVYGKYFENLENYKNQIKELKQYKSVDCIFSLSPNAPYPDKINEKEYSRYLDPYYEIIHKKYNTLKIQALFADRVIPDTLINTHFINTHYFSYVHAVKKSLKKKFSFPNKKWKNFAAFKDKLKQQGIEKHLDEQSIVYLIENIEMYKSFYLDVFKIVKPKIVFIECYFMDAINYGCIAACKELNIKSVDIQHGISKSFMYTFWNKIPVGGYELLPDYYWVWSKLDFRNIENSGNKDRNLAPIVGGNMWLGKYKKNELGHGEFNEPLLLVLKPYVKKVLVTLQWGIGFSQAIQDSIIQSPENWVWLLRLHPLSNVGEIEIVRTFAKNRKNVEVELSSKVNLYFLFTQIDCHLTDSSMCAIEAISFQKPTIITNMNYYEMFKDFIDSQNFYISDNPETILNLINSDISVNKLTIDDLKIETNEEVAYEALSKISG